MNLTYQNDHDHNLDLIANGKHGDFLLHVQNCTNLYCFNLHNLCTQIFALLANPLCTFFSQTLAQTLLILLYTLVHYTPWNQENMKKIRKYNNSQVAHDFILWEAPTTWHQTQFTPSLGAKSNFLSHWFSLQNFAQFVYSLGPCIKETWGCNAVFILLYFMDNSTTCWM
jgi:hypothetical protein